ncbi:LysR family transcriptional regulator [Pseudaeromonas sp. ZJS20]|uniref:LysR family transcriptional regulator n=1 Tax=Pseudaeromonas aegiceratis TaxID=3153928 RepID=UPI00390CB368
MEPNAAAERLLRNLDWNLLFLFFTIVEEEGITAAAQRLNLSQPSVSNGLKRLEEQLGARLLLRRKGAFALTYQGRRLYEDTAAVHRILRQLAGHFAAAAPELRGQLDLAVASHLHLPALDRTLGAFHQRYPQVTYNLSVLPSTEIIAAVAAGQLGIGLCTMQRPQAGVDYQLLGHEQMAFYCGRAHPLYGQEELTLEQLQGFAYVSFESEQPSQGLQAITRLRQEHALWGNLIGVSPNDEEVRRLILAGVGFGVLTVSGAAPFVANGDLWPLPPYEDLPMVDIYLVSRSQGLSVAEATFISRLKEEAHQDLQRRYFAGGPGVSA